MSLNIWKSPWRMCEYESFQENILFCYDGFYFSMHWLVNLFSFYFREAIFIEYFLMGPKHACVFAHRYLHIYGYDKCMYAHIHTLPRKGHELLFLFICGLYFILDSKNIFLTYSLPTADNKSTILKVIEDDSFSAVIIQCFL